MLLLCGSIGGALAIPEASRAAESGQGAVVVMYHRFGEEAYPAGNIRLEQFEAHVEALTSGRYAVLRLARIVSALADGQPLPDRAVAITIDDAFASVYRHAWPRLREARLPFTLFLATASPGGSDHMTWDQLRELAASGLVDFGSQSVSHGHMTELPRQRVESELERSRARIRRELGVEAAFFAYPYGEISLALRDLVVAAGYRAAFGQHSGAIGRAFDRYRLPRFALSENYGDLERFRLVADALPLPVRDVTPRDPRLTTASNPPAYGFTVADEIQDLDRIACYGLGLTLPVELLGSNRVEVRAPLAFKPGRTRINCTLPGPDGRWRWLGRQFYLPSG